MFNLQLSTTRIVFSASVPQSAPRKNRAQSDKQKYGRQEILSNRRESLDDLRANGNLEFTPWRRCGSFDSDVVQQQIYDDREHQTNMPRKSGCYIAQIVKRAVPFLFHFRSIAPVSSESGNIKAPGPSAPFLAMYRRVRSAA